MNRHRKKGKLLLVKKNEKEKEKEEKEMKKAHTSNITYKKFHTNKIKRLAVRIGRDATYFRSCLQSVYLSLYYG